MRREELGSYSDEYGMRIDGRMKPLNPLATSLKCPLDLIEWAKPEWVTIRKPKELPDDTFFIQVSVDRGYINYALKLENGKKLGLAWSLIHSRFVISDCYKYLQEFYLDILKVLHKYCSENIHPIID